MRAFRIPDLVKASLVAGIRPHYHKNDLASIIAVSILVKALQEVLT